MGIPGLLDSTNCSELLKEVELERAVIANEVKQSPEIAASRRPVHLAVQRLSPRNDYFIKPFTLILKGIIELSLRKRKYWDHLPIR
jgi:hypothetical protein